MYVVEQVEADARQAAACPEGKIVFRSGRVFLWTGKPIPIRPTGYVTGAQFEGGFTNFLLDGCWLHDAARQLENCPPPKAVLHTDRDLTDLYLGAKRIRAVYKCADGPFLPQEEALLFQIALFPNVLKEENPQKLCSYLQKVLSLYEELYRSPLGSIPTSGAAAAVLEHGLFALGLTE